MHSFDFSLEEKIPRFMRLLRAGNQRDFPGRKTAPGGQVTHRQGRGREVGAARPLAASHTKLTEFELLNVVYRSPTIQTYTNSWIPPQVFLHVYESNMYHQCVFDFL